MQYTKKPYPRRPHPKTHRDIRVFFRGLNIYFFSAIKGWFTVFKKKIFANLQKIALESMTFVLIGNELRNKFQAHTIHTYRTYCRMYKTFVEDSYKIYMPCIITILETQLGILYITCNPSITLDYLQSLCTNNFMWQQAVQSLLFYTTT